MKLKIIAICLLISSLQIFAQEKKEGNLAWDEGKVVILAGYGFPNLVKVILKTAINSANKANQNSTTDQYNLDVKGFGPVLFKGEYAVSKLIGIGVTGGYWSTSLIGTHNYVDQVYNNNTNSYVTTAYQDVVTYKVTSLGIGARINFHFATTEKLDPYAGIGAGFSNSMSSITKASSNSCIRI